MLSACTCKSTAPRRKPSHEQAAIRQALKFVEMAEYCFPVSAQPILEALRQCAAPIHSREGEQL